jgi:hypothetical protein
VVKKAKISLKSPKTEFGAQNQYGRATYPSIGNFTWSKKIYTFRGQKGQNRRPEPKNRIWGTNSQNFTWSKKTYTFGGQKGKNIKNKFPHEKDKNK